MQMQVVACVITPSVAIEHGSCQILILFTHELKELSTDAQ